ncbi:ATP synthase F1 subunit delta [Candidatus Parcubacteria bacterium]|nr:ATP synthase F1 subunit delta [Patescibacteria group bacterium]MBU4308938.1 ATP synthase F1 subunit delta [Patescibacteria group bacterium]MBU4431828.1 ATP synthase F1 subunit delta [Patescibacteria group bacterium]MBU4577298.1 ATP synthase F1 subunit delta [Patescibacteria group bacterium]MCG2696988.1 ATP synthase F1 subunit delta [Candidatus Parcubacteria bacterium]
MKISLKKYAQALYEATADKSEAEVKLYVKNFVKILAENKDLKRGELIGKYFSKAWNRENGITVVDVTTAQETDKETKKALSEYAIKLLNADKVVIREKVDKDILGGVIIKNGDMVYDGSLRTRIHNLKEQMVK